eukprot:m.205470 g.205470  ORF g.205470 m.205470 type:complete len:104 (+) comp16897_c1_seq5:1695-2006(+)
MDTFRPDHILAYSLPTTPASTILTTWGLSAHRDDRVVKLLSDGFLHWCEENNCLLPLGRTMDGSFTPVSSPKVQINNYTAKTLARLHSDKTTLIRAWLSWSNF